MLFHGFLELGTYLAFSSLSCFLSPSIKASEAHLSTELKKAAGKRGRIFLILFKFDLRSNLQKSCSSLAEICRQGFLLMIYEWGRSHLLASLKSSLSSLEIQVAIIVGVE
ncbi:hypothetical protein NE237_020983 [Protea cynaroides]|uniref:Uncharacterized protein n=1 Tax=Protea cynaroides TaxID=273540 RepID=A0A9Q0HA94_9MAGN|nr:hypothetical protein NE237_020983 [Protea cynaroides]